MSDSNHETMAQRTDSAGLTSSAVLHFWLPLATSWLLMATEKLAVNAVIARMAEARLQLAALGIGFSLALAVESPIIPLLTVSNVLARDRRSLRLLHRSMMGLNAALTAVMLILGFTPLFDLAVVQIIGVPAEIAVKVRPVVWSLTLWPAAIGFRRFYQGVMIRHGYTRQIGYGTTVRFVTAVGVSLAGLAWGKLEGAVAGGLALSASAIAEAAFVYYVSQPAVREVDRTAGPAQADRLTLRGLLPFYFPLALTSMVMLSTAPLINFGLTRSLFPVESLAAWPVVSGQLFVVRSFGFSLQEVVVALLGRPAAMRTLRRFATMVGVGSSALLLAVAFTPLAPWWQQHVAGLDEELTLFAVAALQLAALLPVLAVALNVLRGIVIFGKATALIAQATVINLAVLGAVLLVGAAVDLMPGASLAAVAMTASQLAECAWLCRGLRPAQRQLGERTRAEPMLSLE